ncbi:MAG: uroporphyrinogen decarboxylase family protein [Gemmatimonadota bacterium]
MPAELTARERWRRVFAGQLPDRVPYTDAFWRTTIERWHREGLPADVAPADYFGSELARLGGDYTLQLPERTLEETNRYRVYVDTDGATRKVIRVGDDWTPHWLDFTIRGRDDWHELRAQAAYNPGRIAAGTVAAYRAARAAGQCVVFTAHASFHPTWHKVGLENLLMWMLDDPEWIVEMFEAHARLIADLYDGMKALGMEFDGAWLSDDLGFRTGPLISPAMYRELVQPHHAFLCRHFAADGLKTILHSDGDVRPLIPGFLEAGFGALHPLEAKAGLDVRQLKPQYGRRLILFGNIDATKLAGTPEQVVAEVRAKVEAGKADGGYIFHSDHSVPHDVSLANYRLALQTLAECGRYA